MLAYIFCFIKIHLPSKALMTIDKCIENILKYIYTFLCSSFISKLFRFPLCSSYIHSHFNGLIPIWRVMHVELNGLCQFPQYSPWIIGCHGYVVNILVCSSLKALRKKVHASFTSPPVLARDAVSYFSPYPKLLYLQVCMSFIVSQRRQRT